MCKTCDATSAVADVLAKHDLIGDRFEIRGSDDFHNTMTVVMNVAASAIASLGSEHLRDHAIRTLKNSVRDQVEHRRKTGLGIVPKAH